MPVFDIDLTPKRLVLESYQDKSEGEQFWVEMKVNPVNSSDYDGAMEFIGDSNKVTRWIVTHRITNWNATTSQGQPIEITMENADVILKSPDVYWLYRQIQKPAEGTILEDPQEKKD